MDNAVCLGKDQIEVNPGHWRKSTNSTTIVECILEESCKGGYIDTQDTEINPTNCADGYKGNLCSKCVITQDLQYERINGFE